MTIKKKCKLCLTCINNLAKEYKYSLDSLMAKSLSVKNEQELNNLTDIFVSIIKKTDFCLNINKDLFLYICNNND